MQWMQMEYSNWHIIKWYAWCWYVNRSMNINRCAFISMRFIAQYRQWVYSISAGVWRELQREKNRFALWLTDMKGCFDISLILGENCSSISVLAHIHDTKSCSFKTIDLMVERNTLTFMLYSKDACDVCAKMLTNSFWQLNNSHTCVFE